MKTQELVNAIANDFQQTMEEEGFETFVEMKECYWWDSQDIRDEVDGICHSLHIPSDYEYSYYVEDMEEDLTYSKLIRKVYALLKKNGKYGEE